jgi:glutaredoxin-related protein
MSTDTTEVVSRIKQHLSAEPVVLFMKGTPDFPQCGFSAQTVAALRQVGAHFHAVNIFEDLNFVTRCHTRTGQLSPAV